MVEERRREVAQVYKLLLPYCRLQRRGLLTLSLAAVHLAIIKDCSTADPSRRTNRREGSNLLCTCFTLSKSISFLDSISISSTMCPSQSPCHISRLCLGSMALSSLRRRRQDKAVQPFQVASTNQIRRTNSEFVVDCASKSSSFLSSSLSQPQLICDSFSSTRHHFTSSSSSTHNSSSSSRSYKTCSPTAFFIILSLITLLSAHINFVSASGFFELQVLDGVHNSTTVHVCLKEFWNSQINFNRCTFGQKTVIFNSNNNTGNDAQQHNRRQSTVKVPFSFRWIVSLSKNAPFVRVQYPGEFSTSADQWSVAFGQLST